jgi:uncharacterized membrane protein
MARWFSIRPAITFRGRSFLGIRGWSGKPTHPPLTDFPIAAYVLAAVFDVTSFIASKGSHAGAARDAFIAATYVIIGGGVVSLATATTGFWDWWKGVERHPSSGPIGKAAHTQVWRTVNWHAMVMLTVTLIVVADVILRLSQFHDGAASLSVMVLSVLAGVLVLYGSFYGGSLVFEHEFNVETLNGSTVWDETEKDQLPGEKQGS